MASIGPSLGLTPRRRPAPQSPTQLGKRQHELMSSLLCHDAKLVAVSSTLGSTPIRTRVYSPLRASFLHALDSHQNRLGSVLSQTSSVRRPERRTPCLVAVTFSRAGSYGSPHDASGKADATRTRRGRRLSWPSVRASIGLTAEGGRLPDRREEQEAPRAARGPPLVKRARRHETCYEAAACFSYQGA